MKKISDEEEKNKEFKFHFKKCMKIVKKMMTMEEFCGMCTGLIVKGPNSYLIVRENGWKVESTLEETYQ